MRIEGGEGGKTHADWGGKAVGRAHCGHACISGKRASVQGQAVRIEGGEGGKKPTARKRLSQRKATSLKRTIVVWSHGRTHG